MNALSRETFEGMDEGSKLNILFDYVSSNHKCACETQEELTELKQQFERRKKFDTTVAGAAGVVGGISVHFGLCRCPGSQGESGSGGPKIGS